MAIIMGRDLDDSVVSRASQLFAVDLAFVIMAFLAVVMRCYVRIIMVKGFGLDDYTMVAALMSYIVYCSFSINGTFHGTGRHADSTPIEERNIAMWSWWFCYLFYSVTMIISKVSIGYFLLRVTVKKAHTWIIYGAVLLSIFAGVIFFFVTLFQCNPISYFWNQNHQDGTCIDPNIIIALAFIYSIFSVICDFTLALLPAFLIAGLKMNKRTKVLLIPLMAMGTIASAGVIVRMPYLTKIKDPDFLWSTTDVAIWSTIEQGLAITAGSLATLRPLIRLAYAKLGYKTSRPSNYGLGGTGKPLGSGHIGSRGPRDMYSLSSVPKESEQGWNEQQHTDDPPMGIRTFISTGKQSPSGRTDSEEELRPTGNSKEEIDFRRVVVAKTFLTTTEEMR
ncbi:uncharacterized protein BCR38DRAFT_49229 [Pseudomassariella vexata]|uniref:Rhodopsin domain-containing protein n=1 Tax=Pseudomassariella vexata TaxID=1141098 RepID=A0A1Y2DP19_9PEZI|nr:uncharacterized protein BCR38DRAFT_49229 [Pseudomassariella vexata]ORY60919.1 hypothetical protein BCR38DRAFT_49229 [Pseudomassariella vexata]